MKRHLKVEANRKHQQWFKILILEMGASMLYHRTITV